MSDSPQDHDPIDEAFAAYLRSCDAGELHSRKEFLAQFPEIAEELSQLIEAADMVGQMTLANSSIASEDASVDLPVPIADTGAETLALEPRGPAGDPNATLPMANRAKGDPGPTLPYELGNDYLLLQEIGRGGMGVVYLAKQKELDRNVAVKMIRSGMLADESEVKRFYTEARAAARLHHPGIVAVYQINRFEGHHFFSMEYVKGTDLQQRINSSELSPKEAARYVRDVAQAIHHAHQKGVLHRDLKPANVLIDDQDRIHVTDFGLAKHMDADSSVTGSGTAVGTPHYMAPEQAGGHSDRASRQSDVYSLGAILFACVAGRPPIVADTVMQTLMQVVHHPAPPVRSIRSDVPVDLETIIAKCLEKKPSKRYESADELAQELTAHLEGRPIAARPRSRAMKAWHWIEGVPLVAALSGRRVLHTSAAHQRVQAAMLLLALITPIVGAAFFTLWQQSKNRMPDVVQIAGGLDRGVYNVLSNELATRLRAAHPVDAKPRTTGGSLDNRELLLTGQVDLAPMQATALGGKELAVVAPLFDEVLYVIAQQDTSIQSIYDLRDHQVAVGPQGSGSRATAELVFQTLKLTPEIVTRDWEHLRDDDAPEAAMICIGRGSKLISDLLSSGRWRLVEIPTDLGMQIIDDHPTFRPTAIAASEIPNASPNALEISTVRTTAFLAARKDAPDDLVVATLEALYEGPPPCPELIPREKAVEWPELDYHDAASEYFKPLQITAESSALMN